MWGLRSRIKELESENAKLRDELGDLIAVINRDGGQRAKECGDLAVMDAIKTVANLLTVYDYVKHMLDDAMTDSDKFAKARGGMKL